MAGYTHVLAATDFSDYSRLAAQRAADIAQRDGARLSLLHIVDYFPEDTPMELVAPEDEDPAAYLERHVRARLETLAREVGRGDAEQVVDFTTHSARHEIADVARRQGADLIVLAMHGRRGLAEHLGSTAHGVLHAAACDVLIVGTR